MSGLQRSSHSYFGGNRPKRYFGELVELMKRKKILSDERKFNPEWNKNRKAA